MHAYTRQQIPRFVRVEVLRTKELGCTGQGIHVRNRYGMPEAAMGVDAFLQ